MLETYIPWAEARGVQVAGEISAVRFLAQGRRATEVMLRTDIGGLKRVRVKKAVITAGGVIASSHFLMRSDIVGNVGQRVSCNMAFPVAFDFADRLDAFDGVQITLEHSMPRRGRSSRLISIRPDRSPFLFPSISIALPERWIAIATW